MKTVIQRVKSAAVEINNQVHTHINHGMLVLVGIEKKDEFSQAETLARKIANLRIFEDDQHKMNLTLSEIKGELLVVSEFTLGANLSCGNRPSFDKVTPAAEAELIYQHFVRKLSEYLNQPVRTGVFGARMLVTIQNDGPVTFVL